MECEMCGSREAVVKILVEGVVLNVCEKCSRYGKIIQEKSIEIEKEREKEVSLFEEVPIEDFSKTVRKLREENKLTQEELANKIKEKVSVIKRIEEGWIPPEDVIKKLEKFFEIKLTEKIETTQIIEKKPEEKLTLGDIVDVVIKKK